MIRLDRIKVRAMCAHMRCVLRNARPSRRRVAVRHLAVGPRMNGWKMRLPKQPLDNLTPRLLRCEGGQ